MMKLDLNAFETKYYYNNSFVSRSQRKLTIK